MIDIAAIDPNDPQQVGKLVDTVRYHLDAEQCCDFLVAMYRWINVRDAPTTPSHAAYLQEFEAWRHFVLEVITSQTPASVDA